MVLPRKIVLKTLIEIILKTTVDSHIGCVYTEPAESAVSAFAPFILCCKQIAHLRMGRKIGFASLKTGQLLKRKYFTEHKNNHDMYKRVYFSLSVL